MNGNERADSGRLHRRTFLTGAALAATAGAVASTAHPVAAAGAADLSVWFSDVSNFDGVHDERGNESVTVRVGAAGNGGTFAFDPAAIRVDPGTTVVWKWTGEGGSHNVVDEDGAFESDLVGEAGHTFEHTFESEGVSRYACVPHRAMGMKGAVVVGDVVVETAPKPTPKPVTYEARQPDYGDWFDGVAGYEGTADLRGHSRVTVQVSDEGFYPPALHVDPGTDVVWEWVGDSSHQIEAQDGAYESALQSEGRYAVEFDGVGVSKYGCTQHGLPMRGAVVVGDVFEGTGVLDTTELGVLGLFGTGIVSPLLFGALLWAKRRGGQSFEEE